VSTTIRLTRMGRKKRPFYRLVVLDSRKRRDGAYLANLGFYNPFCEPHEIKIQSDEIIAWLNKGATVSDTARSLLRTEGVLYKYSLVKKGLDAGEIETRMEEWRTTAEANRQQRLDAMAAKVAKAEAEAKATAEAEAKAAAEVEAAEKAAEKAAAMAEAKAKAEAEAAEKAAEEAAAAEEAVEEAPAAEAAEEAPVEAAPENAEPEVAVAEESEEEKKEEDK
jgi:small subunit ribosomal protein S16